MNFISKIMEFLVSSFFKIYFLIFPKKKINSNFQKAIDLYKGEGFSELFAEIRVWDAPYEEVNKLIKKNAKILDLGCGDGLLANYLAIASSKRKILGVDLNKKRINRAYKGLKNTEFKYGDVLKTNINSYNQIILAHVLHHLPNKNMQIKLLNEISNKLKKTDRLLILEIDQKPLLKYIFTWLTDAITVPILFEGKFFDTNFFYRSSNEWRSILIGMGYKVKMKSVHKGMPFSHVLINAEKIK